MTTTSLGAGSACYWRAHRFHWQAVPRRPMAVRQACKCAQLWRSTKLVSHANRALSSRSSFLRVQARTRSMTAFRSRCIARSWRQVHDQVPVCRLPGRACATQMGSRPRSRWWGGGQLPLSWDAAVGAHQPARSTLPGRLQSRRRSEQSWRQVPVRMPGQRLPAWRMLQVRGGRYNVKVGSRHF